MTRGSGKDPEPYDRPRTRVCASHPVCVRCQLKAEYFIHSVQQFHVDITPKVIARECEKIKSKLRNGYMRTIRTVVKVLNKVLK